MLLLVPVQATDGDVAPFMWCRSPWSSHLNAAASLAVIVAVLGCESNGDGLGVGAGDVTDDRRTVAVVLGVVGGVDVGLRVGRRFGEGDVSFDATGADAADAADLRSAIPGPVGATG